MEQLHIQEIILPDNNKYSGWGYYKDGDFIPNGCGKKFFKNYHIFGNYINGIVDGPAIENHGYSMFTAIFKNNQKNGWGLSIDHGCLKEFGYYKNDRMIINMTEYVQWYYQIMTTIAQKGRKIMPSTSTFKDSKMVAEILIGYKGSVDISEWTVEPYMGFRFESDGSIWVGDSDDRSQTGNLMHFRSDGIVDVANFNKGDIVNRLDLHDMIDNKYLKIWEYDDTRPFVLEEFFDKVKIRELCNKDTELKVNFNYIFNMYDEEDEDYEGLPF